MLFSIIRHDRANSFDLRLSERPKHLEYLKIVQQKIQYGGALLENDGKQIGSILIIDAIDHADAIAFADADPYVEVNLFASTVVEAFRQVFQDGTRI